MQPSAVEQIKPWIERFRAQYPMGGLVTSLAVVHGEQYIVQATLSVGGIALTSGLAEAPELQEAEAIAQGIALDRFGLGKVAASAVATSAAATNTAATSAVAANGHNPSPPQPISNSHALADEPLAEPEPPSTAKPNPRSEPKPANKPAKPKKAKGKKSKPPEPLAEPAQAPTGAPMSDLAQEPADLETTITEATTTEATTTEATATEATTFVADWSDDLAQIQVELKRLNWDANQSSDYLQRTYGKPSLDYITDHGELMDFLSYLRALPTHFDPGQFAELTPTPEAPAPETSAEISAPEAPIMGDPMGSPGIETVGIEPIGIETVSIDAAEAVAAVDAPEVPPEVSPEVPPEMPATEPVEEPVVEAETANFGGLSRDDMMQQSAAECKRLKWTNRQGSNFLKARYGKPTRKDLDDAELWDFLQYLSSIAPVEDSIKEKLPF